MHARKERMSKHLLLSLIRIFFKFKIIFIGSYWQVKEDFVTIQYESFVHHPYLKQIFCLFYLLFLDFTDHASPCYILDTIRNSFTRKDAQSLLCSILIHGEEVIKFQSFYYELKNQKKNTFTLILIVAMTQDTLV